MAGYDNWGNPIPDSPAQNSSNPSLSGSVPNNRINQALNFFNTSNQNKLGALSKQANKPASPAEPLPQNAAPPMPTPGKNGYTPTNAPYGMDQTNPGVQEQFWNQNQNLWTKGAFQGPGQGEQFWNQVSGSFNTPGGKGNLQPQFDAAYDRAKDKAVGSANQQAASRGVYGSSSALNNVGNVISDIEAARAKESSNFALANSANQRANLGQYGSLAFQAQNADLANRGFDLAALNTAYNAAGAAQGGRNNRIQGAFDNAFRQQEYALGYFGGQYDGLLGTDYDIYSGATGAGPAATADAMGRSDARRNQNYQDASLGLGIYGAFGGGSPSPGQPAPNPGYDPYYGGYGRVY